MKKKQAVSEQACLQVLRAIENERIESKFMSYPIISSRSTYSANYTQAVMSELKKRGWITVESGNRIGWKELSLQKLVEKCSELL
jgi:DNA-binding IscR family transcriptional regulator